MSKKEYGKSPIPAFEKINSIQKLLICFGLAVVVYFVVEIKNIDPLTHIMIGWDTFSICMIVMTWITFFITTAKQIRIQSNVQDPNRSVIFIIILICTLASFLTVLLLIVTKKEGENVAAWRLPIAVAGMVFSSDLTQGTQPEMLNGEKVTISLSNGATVKGISNISASNIIATNIMATNGVIHKIDQVLLP